MFRTLLLTSLLLITAKASEHHPYHEALHQHRSPDYVANVDIANGYGGDYSAEPPSTGVRNQDEDPTIFCAPIQNYIPTMVTAIRHQITGIKDKMCGVKANSCVFIACDKGAVDWDAGGIELCNEVLYYSHSSSHMGTQLTVNPVEFNLHRQFPMSST
ncbi:hypothetical protein HYALB_00005172 [Hymenoscyphus albidus]|uniref:Uncharacterized protein n=1 Tax=Hymenoscyphus albidus TaxID=595503 RepID=A0A9N9LRK1_9HELO|nr:hypothetical protein HYALB_00005172 [Hymenoscyphus albidus]